MRLPSKAKQSAIQILFLNGFSLRTVSRYLRVPYRVTCEVVRRLMGRRCWS